MLWNTAVLKSVAEYYISAIEQQVFDYQKQF